MTMKDYQRIKPFSECENTLRNDVLQTASDLHAAGVQPELRNPAGETHMSLFGNNIEKDSAHFLKVDWNEN